MANKLLPFICYGGSAVFGKGLALLALPFLTHHIAPSELAKLDMIASVVEPLGILALFGLSEMLFRFSGKTADDQRGLIEELLGVALIGSLVLVLITQTLFIPWVATFPNTPGETALRAILFSACIGAFIELPLAYLRLAERPFGFFLFVMGRSVGQLVVLAIALRKDLGVDGILVGNTILDIIVIGALILTLPKGIKPCINVTTLCRFLSYGIPLVLGSFAMFSLGSFDRWFLGNAVSPEAIANYAIATKFALGLSLLILPFSLWWYPRRYKVLGGPRGLELTSSFWAIGILAFGSCAVIAATFGALVIRLALPASYLPAIALLPPLLSIALLQETASLSNGATYARASGWHVLTINLGGALIAVSLYVLLIPTLGVNGAIIATLAGQGFRLAAFLMAKHEGQSVPLPIVRGGIFLAACLVVVTQICQIGPANLMTLLGSLASVLVAAAFLLLYSWQRHNQVVAA